jgi:hypothetical protein
VLHILRALMPLRDPKPSDSSSSSSSAVPQPKVSGSILFTRSASAR